MTILEPIDGAILSGVFDVNGQVDNVIDDVVVMIRVDGGEWQVARGGRNWYMTLESSALGEGPQEIEVLAVEGDDEGMAKVTIRVEPKVLEIDDTIPWALLISIVVVLGVAIIIRKMVLNRNP